MGACRMPLLLTLTAAAAELPMSVGGGSHEHALRRLPDDAPTAADGRHRVATGDGASAAAAAAVEDDNKAYIVGRPLFKVPPSSPCRRANSARC